MPKVHPTIIIGFTAADREKINADFLVLRPDLVDDPEGVERALADLARNEMLKRLKAEVEAHKERARAEDLNRQKAEHEATLRPDPLAPPPVFDGLLVESSPPTLP